MAYYKIAEKRILTSFRGFFFFFRSILDVYLIKAESHLKIETRVSERWTNQLQKNTF